MLTRVEQIVTAAHRDLQSCTHTPTNEPRSHAKNQVSLTYLVVYGSKSKSSAGKSRREQAFSSQLSLIAQGMLVTMSATELLQTVQAVNSDY